MKVLNLIVLLAVITINALANILPINGISTGDVSAAYDNYFTPAGFTFSIWSLIYLGLLLFSIYQFYSKAFKPDSIGLYFVINGFANIAWILAWHFQYLAVTLLFMSILLYTLVIINLRIKDHSWQVKLPFQIYLGWICVATVANVSVYLTFLDWSIKGISGESWGILLVIIAGLIGLFLLIRQRWMAAALTIAWGIWGIYNKQVDMDRAVLYQKTCLAVIGVLLLVALFQQIYLLKRSRV